MKENNKLQKFTQNNQNKTFGNQNHNDNNNQQNYTKEQSQMGTDTKKNSIFEEAAKKLKILEKGQKEAERYFKTRDANENKLKLLESNLKKQVLMDKRANSTLDEKTLDRLSDILKNISDLDVNVVKYFDQPKKNCEVQTEQEDLKILNDKMLKLEKENENLHNKKSKLKSEIEILKNENINLQKINEKQAKEIKTLQANFEEVSSQRSDIEIKLKELTRYNENLVESVKKHDKLIKEYNDLKFAMEDSIKLEREKYDFEETRRIQIYNEFQGNFIIIPQLDMMNEITKFLPSKDIGNMLLTSKSIHYSIKNNKECIKNFYNGIILQMKKKIAQLNNFDVKSEYIINDSEIERLFKEYLTGKKTLAKELRPVINKAITFLNKDVKLHLGMKVNVNTPKKNRDGNSGNITPKSENAGILGGIANMFSGSLFGKQDQKLSNSSLQQTVTTSNKKTFTGPLSRGDTINRSNDSLSSSRAMSFIGGSADNTSDVDNYDKYLLNELSLQKEEFVDFDYNTPEEIRVILNKFLKSDMPTEKLTAFIKEICLEYSEFLYFSYKITNELKEIDLVKNCLNERFRKLNKICFQLEAELNELRGPSNFNKINRQLSIKHENIEELKFKLSNKENEINILKLDNEASQRIINQLKCKEERFSTEYNTIKTLFSKEIRLLKFDLDDITKQRDQLKNFILEFKNQINLYNSN